MGAATARGRQLVVAGVLLAVVSPALRNHDSFPLSTYPVYANVRPREMTIATAVGELRDGTERQLSMAVIAATDDPLIAEQRVADAVAAGRADELCARIAARAPSIVVEVMVVHERHDAVHAARGEPSLLSRTVHARCPNEP